MCIRPIRNDQDYEKTLQLVDTLWSAQENSYESDILEISIELIENYEKKRWGIDFPDPIEALKFYMTQKDKNFDDLAQLVGSADTTLHLLNKKTPLTTAMIYKLCTQWEIPAECLIQPYDPAQ